MGVEQLSSPESDMGRMVGRTLAALRAQERRRPVHAGSVSVRPIHAAIGSAGAIEKEHEHRPDIALGTPLGSTVELDLRLPRIGVSELALALVLGRERAYDVDAPHVICLAHALRPSIDHLGGGGLAGDLAMGRAHERLWRMPEIDVDHVGPRTGAREVGLQLKGPVRRPSLGASTGRRTIESRHAYTTRNAREEDEAERHALGLHSAFLEQDLPASRKVCIIDDFAGAEADYLEYFVPS